MRAIDKLKRLALADKDNLPRQMSIEYIDMIRKNIYAGTYSSTYSPYNERYRKWKYLVFNSRGGFWNLRTELITSLTSKKIRGGWFGGVPAGVHDSGNVSWLGKGNRGRRMLIAQYAIWMEYGRSGQPSRPLFGPTLIDYAAKKAPIKLEGSRKRLMGAWR
jgi:hypothetical protein